MHSSDYEILANVIGHALGETCREYGEDARTHLYDCLYRPLVSRLQRDNPRFDNLKFAYAVGTSETFYRQASSDLDRRRERAARAASYDAS